MKILKCVVLFLCLLAATLAQAALIGFVVASPAHAGETVSYQGEMRVMDKPPGYYMECSVQLAFYNVFIETTSPEQDAYLKACAEKNAKVFMKGEGFSKDFNLHIKPSSIYLIEIPKKK